MAVEAASASTIQLTRTIDLALFVCQLVVILLPRTFCCMRAGSKLGTLRLWRCQWAASFAAQSLRVGQACASGCYALRDWLPVFCGSHGVHCQWHRHGDSPRV